MCLTSREDGSTSLWGGTQQRLLEALTLLSPAHRVARSTRSVRLKRTAAPQACSSLSVSRFLLVLFPQPCLCLDLYTASLLRPFQRTPIPSCKGTCTITSMGLDWLDLKLDRWMNVTRWLVSRAEIMSVFTDDKTEKKVSACCCSY